MTIGTPPPSFAIRKRRTRIRKWWPLFVESARLNETRNDFLRRTGLHWAATELNAKNLGHVWAVRGERMARAPRKPEGYDACLPDEVRTANGFKRFTKKQMAAACRDPNRKPLLKWYEIGMDTEL